jgi:predicted DNA-binding protein
MPTSNPRINVTFSESDAEMMHLICKKKKMSMSGLIRKVMEEWLEEYEDMFLAKRTEEAYERWEKDGKKILSHEELWKRLGT